MNKTEEFQKIINLPDLVISAETDPVREGTVLLHLLAEDALGLKGLVRRLFFNKKK